MKKPFSELGGGAVWLFLTSGFVVGTSGQLGRSANASSQQLGRRSPRCGALMLAPLPLPPRLCVSRKLECGLETGVERSHPGKGRTHFKC